MSYAQAGQDDWVVAHHPEPGYFVDVGAHDGVTHSNTYMLERLGWAGLCIEPNREAFTALRAARTCKAYEVVASETIGIARFDGVRVGQGAWTTTAPLTMLLEAAHSPTAIDFLSIDVEGHELEVLAGMDFDRWQVELIAIEHNRYCDGLARKNAIHAGLTAHGFRRVAEDVVAPGYGPYEDWYQRA